jgi:acyl carrier protein
MGIDLFDLLLRVERSFRIRVRRDEALRAFGSGTVGELYTFVLEKMGGTRWPFCLGVPVFVRVREALVGEFGVAPERVTPSSDLAGLVPAGRRAWDRLGRAIRVPLPPLERPAWAGRLASGFFIKGLFCLLPAFAGFLIAGRLGRAGGFGVLTGFGLGALVLAATTPLAVRVPASCATVKGLIKALLQTHYGLLSEQEQMAHHREVWEVLRAVIVESLNVPPEAVTPSAHLVYDLGA